MRYKTVLFDLDGTLFDTSEGLFAYTVQIVKQYGLGTPTSEQLKKTIGPFLRDSFRDLFGAKEEMLDPMMADFYKGYNQNGYQMSTIYPDIEKLLQSLHAQGVTIGVATLKQDEAANKMMDYFGLRPYLSAVCGASDDDSVSTKADVIRLALKQLGNPAPHTVLLVGDSANDALGAKACGLDFLAVTYGFGFHCAQDAAVFGPVFTASSAQEVLDFLTQ